ncbi:hypothetical protein HK099_006049 [Clydaea vesicula]|uniref:Uncharacterized protein n=1 Tax=Clydaea vesicula TaxID=447962 RepID=A0AAD5UBC8_9FUNG|nr:hypothetical protein HK099_006049 [Clydaea vesicula]KAJ3397520.1 hypothetical protein HDU92_007183 [Lobulomyces angularis]
MTLCTSTLSTSPSTNHTKEECDNAILRLKTDPITKDFPVHFDYLFYTGIDDLCNDVEVVIYASKILVKSCNQFVDEESDIQENAVYASWSNEKAARGACKPVKKYKYCVNQVLNAANLDTITKKELCTPCQKSFWKPILNNVNLAPSTFYWSIMDKKGYLNKIEEVCGKNFFGKN